MVLREDGVGPAPEHLTDVERATLPCAGLTAGAGVDHVVEVGGAGTLQQSLRAVRVGGQLTIIGVLSRVASEVNILPILMKGGAPARNPGGLARGV